MIAQKIIVYLLYYPSIEYVRAIAGIFLVSSFEFIIYTIDYMYENLSSSKYLNIAIKIIFIASDNTARYIL